MAGSWIKVEGATIDKPEVLKIARLTGIHKDEVLGKLVRIWRWFDDNSVDGVVDGAVSLDIDGLVERPGFAAAMVGVGWLTADDERQQVVMVRFDRHNGESSKKRALKNERQARWRASSETTDESTDTSTRKSTNASTRIEKNRVEESVRPPSASADSLSPLPSPSTPEKRPSLETVVTPPRPVVAVPRETKSARGTRFDPTGGLPGEWRAWCAENRPDLMPELTFASFSDFWTARPGAAAVKLDWFATWRNWCRKERQGSSGLRPPGGGTGSTPCGNCGKPVGRSYTQSPKGIVCDHCHRGYMAGGWPQTIAPARQAV